MRHESRVTIIKFDNSESIYIELKSMAQNSKNAVLIQMASCLCMPDQTSHPTFN
jgi:hypothetical protein